ncbi:MAG: bifunctional phosphoribosylaminoimidazolecarboxamide formyltransferase/IMP cyclohydrolase [Armatimonadetes bacterium]|nr:bifunctional phosphoribosylaminoimidazolecarboxamide formyltransferase/IMP cyclohydrolase [Armatimonadota bacterium]
MRALLSVTDKTGIVDFARGLVAAGFEILSTGGTASVLREAGLTVTDVSEVTQFPEMLEGRLKTLHPMIHGGLLGDRTKEDHIQQMEEAQIQPIDLLAVNLYAFEKTVSAPHTLAEAIESVDIGGPAMIRAAAKNFLSVTVVTDPDDYGTVLGALASGTVQDLRMRLMAKAYRHTAYYDSKVASYFSKAAGEELFPETLTVGYRRSLAMRYGENPHQKAAMYVDSLGSSGVAQAKQLWGKELSYNNVLDTDAAWELVADMSPGSCAIIKHGNPCGASSMEAFADSYIEARKSDPISAFGGIAAFNGEIDRDAALSMTDKGNFLEVVIGTSFSADALEIFKNRSGWGENVRLLEAALPGSTPEVTIRTIRGGVLVQESDEESELNWKVVTETQPTAEQRKALEFVWKIVKHVKSNAILIGDSKRLLGVGAGQMNRVQSVRLAIEQMGERTNGAVLASDAFFPFPDSVVTAGEAGIMAIVQPGGSKKDEDVIAEANKRGIAMIFTGYRHFRH